MKLRNLLILNLLCIAMTIQAQDAKNRYTDLRHYYLGHFEPDSLAYTLGTEVNLREKASVQGKVMAKLPIATKVIIEKEMTDSMAVNGWKAPWCRVRIGSGATAQKGYIWGGFLTNLCFTSRKDKNIWFIAGISKFNYDKMDVTLQLRAVKNGVELSKIEFKTVGDYGYMIGGQSNGSPNFAGVEECLGIKMIYEACDYAQGEYVVLWDGKKLIYGADGVSASSAEVFYSTTSILLPTDKGGKKDQLIVRTETAQFNEKKKDYDKPKIENKVFRWQNGKLVH